MKKLFVLILMICMSGPAFAAVTSKKIPTASVLEESIFVIQGKTLSSTTNPLAVTLVTADGVRIALDATVNKKATKAEVLIPSIPDSVSGLLQVTLEVSGGDVPSSSPEQFVILLAKRPSNVPSELNAGQISSLPVLPADISSGLGVVPGPQGPAGPEGPQGPQGGAGPIGPTGITPTNVPAGNIIGTVASATVVTQGTQPAITNLPALVGAGTTAVTTTFAGPVTASEGISTTSVTASGTITGNLTGNVTGNVTGNTSGSAATVTSASQSAITTLASLTAAGTTGVTTVFSGPVSASEGFTGPLTGNVTGNASGSAATVTTAAQPAITTLTGLTAAGTTGVTTTFSGPVSAAQGFSTTTISASGTITGNLTGNVTGNTSGSAATFTGSLSGDVGGTQGATTIANSVVTGKLLNGGYASSAGVVADGDSLQTAVSKLDGNVKALTIVVGTPTAANSVSEIVKRDGSGNFAANTITATTFSGNLSGLINSGSSSQPNIQSLTGVQNIGSSGVPITIYGPITAQGLITGTITHSNNADTANVSDSFAGSLAGDVTGTQLATAIANSVVTGKQLNGAYVAGAAALPANGDTLQVAIGKLHGTAIATTASIASINGNVAAATSANTASTIVKRDASGNFAAGTITANLTGNVTGNASTATSAGSATVALAIDGTTGTGTLTYNDGATNFNTVLTATAATALTLPTTGTLATTTGLTPIAVSGSVVTLGSGITTLNVTGLNFFHLTAAAGEDLETLTGAVAGQKVTIIFDSSNVDVMDDNDPTAINAINLDGNYVPSAGDTLEIIFDGSSWYELTRSNN